MRLFVAVLLLWSITRGLDQRGVSPWSSIRI